MAPLSRVPLASLGAMALGFTVAPRRTLPRRPPGRPPAPAPGGELRGLAALGSQEGAAPASAPSADVPQGGRHTFTVTFPSLSGLEDVRRGDCVASSPLQVREHAFRVLLYPRGGGRCSSESDAATTRRGDGLRKQEDAARDNVGVYLQYLAASEDAAVDATFRLRLRGRQRAGPRFDVEATAGTRFVAAGRGDPRRGTAGDCGAHVMRSFLLEEFLGGEGSSEALEVEVEVKLHSPGAARGEGDGDGDGDGKGAGGPLSFEDLRATAGAVRVGRTVVPVLRGLAQRPRMMELGAYPGVEYRVTRILHPETREDLFASVPGADYELAPMYPLVPRLERQWPVRVNERDLPKLLTMDKYNALYALGSLATAAVGLTTAFVLSQLISFFFIPSKSMDPTLLVGDVLVVEKVTSRLKLKDPRVGDVVLFNPNEKLQGVVKATGGRISDRDLFVKRVAAGPGDRVSIDAAGGVRVNGAPAAGRRDLCGEEPLRLIERYVAPVDDLAIEDGEVFVLGDCSSVSVDSRVWGPLKKEDLVGTPLLRIWPLSRMGSVPAIPSTEQSASPLE